MSAAMTPFAAPILKRVGVDGTVKPGAVTSKVIDLTVCDVNGKTFKRK
jgi:hypothetical protein